MEDVSVIKKAAEMNAEHLLTHFDRIADAPDAIPRLRRFILDLAVRGKLVPQDESEGNGASLLVTIEQAWAARVSSGKSKKPIVQEAPGSFDVPFQVPSNWALVRLGEAVELINGRAFKPSDWTQTGLPIVRIQNLNNPDASFNRYDGEVKEKCCIDTGDFLISWSGTPGTSFGAHIWEHGPAVLNQHIFKSILIGATFEAQFLKLAINSRLLELIKQAHGGVGLQHITKPKLQAVVLTLPPLAEQHRIVAKVDELMTLCDRLEAARIEREATRDRMATASLARLNTPDPDPATFQNHAAFALNNLTPLTTRPDQVKALRQTILNLAVRGKLVPQDPNDEPASELLKRRKISVPDTGSFELPESWAWVNVGAVANSRLGKMLDKAKNKGTPRKYLRNINVRWFDFDLSDLLEMRFEDSELPEFSLQRGDVLICEGGEPGRAAVWDDRQTDIYFQKAIHRVRFLNFVDGEFFVKALRASADDGRLAEYFTGTGIKHFTGKGLAAYLFPLPPLAEQHRIVAKVDELMALCDRLEASLAMGDESRGRLLEALLCKAIEPDGNRYELAC